MVDDGNTFVDREKARVVQIGDVVGCPTLISALFIDVCAYMHTFIVCKLRILAELHLDAIFVGS